MMKPSCLIKVPSSLEDGSFFYWWVRFLNPFHGLTSKEMAIAAEFFQHRYELSKNTDDPVLLDKLAIDTDARKAIRNKLNVSYGYINVMISKMRKCGIIVGSRLNPKFLPDIKYKDGKPTFSAYIIFDFKDDDRKDKSLG